MIAILNSVRDILDTDQDLRQKVPLCISARVERDNNVVSAIMNYQGPDEVTVALLAHNHERWLNDPATFWQEPAPPDLSGLIPYAQIVWCFMARNRSDM